MKITCDHKASIRGRPVILNDAGIPMSYASGIAAVRKKLGLTQVQLAAALGMSARTVEHCESGQIPGPGLLNNLGGLLNRHNVRSERLAKSYGVTVSVVENWAKNFRPGVNALSTVEEILKQRGQASGRALVTGSPKDALGKSIA